jgi:hypothetical protein
MALQTALLYANVRITQEALAFLKNLESIQNASNGGGRQDFRQGNGRVNRDVSDENRMRNYQNNERQIRQINFGSGNVNSRGRRFQNSRQSPVSWQGRYSEQSWWRSNDRQRGVEVLDPCTPAFQPGMRAEQQRRNKVSGNISENSHAAD